MVQGTGLDSQPKIAGKSVTDLFTQVLTRWADPN